MVMDGQTYGHKSVIVKSLAQLKVYTNDDCLYETLGHPFSLDLSRGLIQAEIVPGNCVMIANRIVWLNVAMDKKNHRVNPSHL